MSTEATTHAQSPIRVGVLGARGKVGQEVCRAVRADAGTELVADLEIGRAHV